MKFFLCPDAITNPWKVANRHGLVVGRYERQADARRHAETGIVVEAPPAQAACAGFVARMRQDKALGFTSD